MKQLTEKKKKMNIWKWLAAGSVAFVAVFSVITGIFLYRNAQDEQKAECGETELKVETGAVVNEAKTGTRTFLNQPAPAAEAGDSRQVFRIIEVIPHEACSVFPYLVEWGTEKEYDKNTPLGYDGIMMSAQMGSYGGGGGSGFNMFSKKDTIAKDSRPFTYVEEKFVKEYFEKLSDYDVDLYSATDSQRGGNWFRKTKDESTLIEEPYGYFEYVGAGKGLYYVNTSLIAGIKDQYGYVTSTEGVHFEIQAVSREGTESPKGYMFACDPAYFWSRENGNGTAKPDFNGKKVVGLTGYNYDLKFTADKTNGTYIVNNVVYSAVAGDEYAYDIKVKESEIAGWTNGFYYQKGGFYEVASYVEASDGKYIRYADSKSDDGVDPEKLTAGYFLLKESGMYEGATRYNVVFKEAVNGNGNYMAKAPDSYLGDKFTFIYQGKGKGSYKVSFLYAPGSTSVKYDSEIMEVTNGQGAYALATTSTDGDGKAKYSKEESVAGAVYDYAEVVTYIDAYQGATHGDGIDQQWGRKGVTSGAKWGDSEVGGWVFVPLEKEGDMQQTFLKDVKTDSDGRNSNTNAYFTPGDRIYVTGQKRVYRFYCRDGLENNEWFKLLCYSNNPKSDPKNPRPYTEIIDGVGYDLEKTVEYNLSNEVTKQLLDAFDGQYRIEIIQKEPQYLTVEDVTSADLIYISNQEGINGMSKNWNGISDRLKDESLPYCGWTTYCKLTDEQDISPAVLMTLYDECIYKRNRALIVAHSVLKENGDSERTWPITRNLTKLYHMMNYFDNALSWAYFMPDKYPAVANKNYSKIRTPEGYGTATVDVYKGEDYGTYNHVFLEGAAAMPSVEAIATPSVGAGATPTPYPYPKYNLEEWDDEYFQVWTTSAYSSVVEGFEFQNDIGHWANIVQDGETKMTVKYYIDPIFMSAATKSNIWEILRNRNLDNSMLVVEVTNGEMTGGTVPRRVIYADEFDPQSFDIKYKVLLLGSSQNPAALKDITLTFEDGSSAGKGSILQYGEENTNNVRHGFTVDGLSNGALDPSKTVRKVTITATDTNGKKASAEVYVIVREAFMLN